MAKLGRGGIGNKRHFIKILGNRNESGKNSGVHVDFGFNMRVRGYLASFFAFIWNEVSFETKIDTDRQSGKLADRGRCQPAFFHILTPVDHMRAQSSAARHR